MRPRVVLLTTETSLFDASQQANLAALAVQFVQIANGDIVRSLVRESRAAAGSTRSLKSRSQQLLAAGDLHRRDSRARRSGAVRIADRVSDALSSWIKQSQAEQNVPPQVSVSSIKTISEPRAVLVEGRRLTVPIVILLSVLIVTLGLAFILENLKPRSQESLPHELTPAVTPDAESGDPQSVVSSDAKPSAIILPSSIASPDGGQNGSTDEEAKPAGSATCASRCRVER